MTARLALALAAFLMLAWYDAGALVGALLMMTLMLGAWGLYLYWRNRP
jgi:hypothetical protein